MVRTMVPHPIIVDFAVALLVTSVAFDALASLVEERDLRVVSWWTLMIGTVAAALSILSGYAAAAELVAPGPRVLDTIALHRNLGITTLLCFSVCAAWRMRAPGSFPRSYSGTYWILAVTGLCALVITAYNGGILVFRLGVGYVPMG